MVYCIDPYFGTHGDHIFGHGIENNIEPLYRSKPCGAKVIELQGYSYDPKVIERLTSLLNGGKIDLLFHDGDHRYEAAKFDIETYSQFIKPDGWIAVCDWADSTHGVSQYWPEMKKKYETYEFVIQRMPIDKQKSHRWLGFYNGIGLARMPK